MKKIARITAISIFAISIFSVSLFTQDNEENKKLAQAGFHFLNVTSDARASAMGEAVTSVKMGSTSLFFNPATMANFDGMIRFSTSNNKWIADIKHYTADLAIRLFDGNYGVIGFSLQYVDYGNFIRTYVKSNEKGYEDAGIYKLYASAIGIGYAKQLTDKFSIGAQLRWAKQDLGESRIPNPEPVVVDSMGNFSDTAKMVSNKTIPLVIDFGTYFRTGIKSLVFGVSIRNFSGEYKYAYESFQLPMTVSIGISMNLMDLLEKAEPKQSLLVSIDASHYRDHPEQLRIGVEYEVLKTLYLRIGYVTGGDGNDWSYGIGISKFGFAFDYAYTPYKFFSNVQRFTVRFYM